jgi:epoxyqueuosine reductase
VYHLEVALAETIKRRALEIGFDLAGIAPLAVWEDLKFSRQWVERGYGGEMRYLENPKRDDPRRILPSARSVICVGLIYNADLPYSTEVCRPRPPSLGPTRRCHPLPKGEGQEVWSRGDGPRAWISRYAWGKDYHDVMRTKLEQLCAAVEALAQGVETRAYVDTGPVVERAFARLSGIGWMGKNTCLINQQKGSWFFLGVILTSLELAPDLPAPDRCGSCTRCIEACPTGALVEPYVMDGSRCIAYFTIELKGPIPVEFRPAVGANVFGCDICQDVCPWNSRSRGQELGFRGQPREGAAANRVGAAATTGMTEFQPLQIEVEKQPCATFSLFNPLLEALALSEEDFHSLFGRSPLKRTKYRGWLRNLCVAMGNSGDARFVPWLEHVSEHPDPVIREHAEWALARLRGTGHRG